LVLADGELTAKAEAPLCRKRLALSLIVRAGIGAHPFGEKSVVGLPDRRNGWLCCNLRAKGPDNKRRRATALEVIIRSGIAARSVVYHEGINAVELDPLIYRRRSMIGRNTDSFTCATLQVFDWHVVMPVTDVQGLALVLNRFLIIWNRDNNQRSRALVVVIESHHRFANPLPVQHQVPR
jgi:hypothetical protein